MSRSVSGPRKVTLTVGARPTAPKVRGSSFFITVNTNFVPKDDAEATRLGQDLGDAIRKAFENDDTFKPMVIFRGGAPRDFNEIKDVKVDYRPEIGPATGKLHAHILVETVHTVPTGIHLSVAHIRRGIAKYAKERQNQALPYINIRGFNNKATLISYLSKNDDPQVVSFVKAAAD